MEIMALPKLMTEEAAMEIAEKRGNFLGRLLLKEKRITLKLMYLESKEIIYNMTYQSLPLMKKSRLSSGGPQAQKIRMMVEGTQCTPAFLDEPLNTVKVQVDEEDQLQNTAFPEQKLIEEGKYLARRMVRRQSGRNVCMEAESIHSVYRPYYVAFYGDMVEGTRVRYLPIPADGNEIRRTF